MPIAKNRYPKVTNFCRLTDFQLLVNVFSPAKTYQSRSRLSALRIRAMVKKMEVLCMYVKRAI
jgi:hypothetical protein